jgi:hypothetical protein
MAEVKAGSYRRVTKGVETITRSLDAFECGLCEFWASEEEVVKDHVQHPGLHAGGAPKLLKDTEPEPATSAGKRTQQSGETRLDD